MNNNVALVWPPSLFSVEGAHAHYADLVSMVMVYCLYLLRALTRDCSSDSMANEQSFESLNDESSNASDLSSNRKKKGKRVSETVRRGGRSFSRHDFLGKPIWRGLVSLPSFEHFMASFYGL